MRFLSKLRSLNALVRNCVLQQQTGQTNLVYKDANAQLSQITDESNALREQLIKAQRSSGPRATHAKLREDNAVLLKAFMNRTPREIKMKSNV